MTYTPNVTNVMHGPREPGVLCIHCINSAAETNVLVYVPWTYCRLAYAYTVITEAIDATAKIDVKLELNAADGTEMMDVDIAASSSVGDIDEFTVTTASACRELDRANTSRDAVNISIDGSASAAGSFDLFMYFERDIGI